MSIRRTREKSAHLVRSACICRVESLEGRQLLSATTSSGAPLVTPSHVVVVILEDRASGEIGDTTNMPFLNQLASSGLVYSNSHGLNTPSQQGEMNYLALYSGSTQGITDDGGAHAFTATCLADQLNAAGGLSFAGYCEGLPSDGSQVAVAGGVSHGQSAPDLYYRAYNPMAMFDAATNAQVNKSFAEFPTNYATLPTVSFVVPNVFDNTHGSNQEYPWAGSSDPANNNLLKQWSDQWLSTNFGPYLQWAQQNNSLLIVTSDEGDRANGFNSLATNNTTTIVNGSSSLFVPGTDSSSITVYNLLHTIEDMYGLSYLGNAAGAADLDTNAAGQLAGGSIAKAPTSTALASSANPSIAGQSVTFTATISATGGVPTGAVTFLDGSTAMGAGTLNASGVATFTTSSLAVGSHSVTASYPGDTQFAPSVSSALAEVINAATTAPANDNFANATPLSGAPVTATGTNANATKEPGEPNHAGNSGGKSVWWVWTAPSSGTVVIDTHGSSFDTLLGVYTGSSVSTLTKIASNDDDPAGGTTTSKVSFQATAGTVYYIAVDGYGGVSGSITLHVNLGIAPPPPTGVSASQGTFSDGVHLSWSSSTGASSYEIWRASSNNSGKSARIGATASTAFVDATATPGLIYYYWIKAVGSGGTSSFSAATSGFRASTSAPVNDNFANAITLSGTSITATGSNVGASKEPGEPNHAGNSGGKSVWWVWTAPSSGTVTIDTHGSNFDTLLGIYTGTSVSSLTTIASNDDDWQAGLTTSKATFTAVAGTVYYIAVDGYGGAYGSITLHLILS